MAASASVFIVFTLLDYTIKNKMNVMVMIRTVAFIFLIFVICRGGGAWNVFLQVARFTLSCILFNKAKKSCSLDWSFASSFVLPNFVRFATRQKRKHVGLQSVLAATWLCFCLGRRPASLETERWENEYIAELCIEAHALNQCIERRRLILLR